MINSLRDTAAAALNNVRLLLNEPDLTRLTAQLAQYYAIVDLLSTLQKVNKRDEIQSQLDEAVLAMRP